MGLFPQGEDNVNRSHLPLIVNTLFLLACAISLAQPPSGAEHDILTCVERYDTNRYLVGGYSSSFDAQETDAVIALLNLQGQPDWTRTYSTQWWDETAAVTADEDGNCWLAGASRPNDENDLFDWLVIKYDGNGNQLWARTYIPELQAGAVAIAPAGNGRVVIAGFVNTDGHIKTGLMSLNSDGDELWFTLNDQDAHTTTRDLVITEAGEIYAAGNRKTNNENASDIVIMKYSSNGTLVWEYVLTQPWVQECHELDLDSNGNILICGFTCADSLTEQMDGLLVKLTPNGDLLWQQTFGDDADDRLSGLTVLDGDSLLLCGVTQDPISLEKYGWLIMTDPDGEWVWTRSHGYGEHAELRAVAGLTSDQLMAVGFADPSESYMADYFIATATTARAPNPIELPPSFNALIYPNPSNAQMTLELTLPGASDLTVMLSNILGQQLATVAHGHFTAGIHRLPVSLTNVASGSYFVEIQGTQVDAKPIRVVVVK
jgi:Secretion system C-terminal sorting domain